MGISLRLVDDNIIEICTVIEGERQTASKQEVLMTENEKGEGMLLGLVVVVVCVV